MNLSGLPAALLPVRSAYVWDTTEPPFPTPNCYPTIGATGSVVSSTRALGWIGRSVLAGGAQVRLGMGRAACPSVSGMRGRI